MEKMNLSVYIPRPDYVNLLLKYKDTPLVKVISGIRRSGKSVLLKLLAEELVRKGIRPRNIIHLSFDSLEYDGMDAKTLYLMLKKKISSGGNTRKYLFLDEIQEIPGWEKAVNSLMQLNADIYVSGSNSKMLSSEISTYLTGRYVSAQVYPLSFKEYISFRKDNAEDNRSEFARFMRLGGFPVIHSGNYQYDDAYRIVRDIYNSVIFTDIVKRAGIRKTDQLERLVKFLFSNVGNSFSANRIANFFKNEKRPSDVEGIYGMLKNLENAFVINHCSRFDIQGREILKTQEKYYLADAALRYAVLGYKDDSVASMLENTVYLELRRRGYDVYVGKLYKGEIDFAAIRNGERIYVQVTQEIQSGNTLEREYGVLEKIRDNYPKYVLRNDIFAAQDRNGIKTMPVHQFLLAENWQ